MQVEHDLYFHSYNVNAFQYGDRGTKDFDVKAVAVGLYHDGLRETMMNKLKNHLSGKKSRSCKM